MKTCRQCNKRKSLADFHKHPDHKDGRRGDCKDCRRAYERARYERNRKRRNQQSREWRQAHKDRCAVLGRRKHLARCFSLTPDQYGAILKAQRGICAICGRPETRTLHGKVTSLCVDHDHETGKTRGLLCQACNTGLGNFEDSLERLSAAKIYLERHKIVFEESK